jgi:hypothetical protein
MLPSVFTEVIFLFCTLSHLNGFPILVFTTTAESLEDNSLNTKPTVDSETQEKTVHCSSERDAKCTETTLVQKICPTEKSNQFNQTNLPDKTVKHKLKEDVTTEFDKSTKHSHGHLRKKRNGGNVDNEPYEPSELSFGTFRITFRRTMYCFFLCFRINSWLCINRVFV